MNSDQHEGNFSEADRRTLIELAVDMGYTKRALENLRAELSQHSTGVKQEVKALWAAIEDLRKFRWWIAGGIAGASLVGGASARLLFR